VELLAGFDMVNEEDFCERINYFAECILDADKKVRDLGKQDGIPFFFHAGETHDR